MDDSASMDLVAAELAKAQESTAAIRVQHEALEESLTQAIAQESSLRERYVTLKLAANGGEPDWTYLLDDSEPGTSAKYLALKQALFNLTSEPEFQEVAVSQCGYSSAAQAGRCQAVLQIGLVRGLPRLTAQVLAALQDTLLVHVQHWPMRRDRAEPRHKRIYLFESTLSVDGAYFLAIYEALGVYEIWKSSGSREVLQKTVASLPELLRLVETEYFYADATPSDGRGRYL